MVVGIVITVMNMKGGVGKTTVSMHLAGVFARYMIGNKPRKILAIDYDPQFNLSQAFLPAKWPAPGLDDTDLSEPGPALELHRA